MDLLGKTPINPFLFYTGKLAGYACWIILLTSSLEIYSVGQPYNKFFRILSLVLATGGMILVMVSLINLGRSTRLGVPTDDTILKTGGLYKYSRNPMYFGFSLFTISAILYTWHVFILLVGIYSLIIYHFIILGEEKFLKQRFGEEYEQYIQKVRRYI